MKGTDAIGKVVLVITLGAIVFLSPGFGNYIQLLAFVHDKDQFQERLEDKRNHRKEVMMDSVRLLGIEDSGLKKCVTDKAKLLASINEGSSGSKSDVREIDYLACPRMNIKNLRGIEGLANLRSLSLSDNSIKDLKPLSRLSNLEILGVARNRVDDISPLVKLDKLKRLNISGNPVIDVRKLSVMTGLKYLSMVNLDRVYCADIQYLQTFPHIRNASNLETLYCAGKQSRYISQILRKDRSEWTRKEEEAYLHYKINKTRHELDRL